MEKKTYVLKNRIVYLQKETYRQNNTLAVLIYEEDGELFGDLTVNLGSPLQSDCLAFLDENNLPGIGQWIEEHGLGVDMGVWEQSGFCRYPLYMLFTDRL